MATQLFPSIQPTSSDSNTDSTDEITATLKAGGCPWCDSYEGDHPRQHASAAHASAYDEWSSESGSDTEPKQEA